MRIPAPLQWSVDRSCLTPLPVPADPNNPTAVEVAAIEAAQASRDANEAVAVHVMWALSGRQFGACPVVHRPDGDHCAPRPIFPPHRGCCPTTGAWVTLPGPVAAVVSVDVAGVPIDPSSWALEGDRLYRTGGHAWPSQNWDRPAGEPGTWSVTYLRGLPVPAGVDKLTGLLAKEFVAACEGGKCRLPRTVVSTTQRGVTHSFDPARILAAGKTGIPEIDSWLAAVNPHRIAEAPVVL